MLTLFLTGLVAALTNARDYCLVDDNFSLDISVTADNVYELYVNGALVDTDNDWRDLEVYSSIPLQAGANIIAVKVTGEFFIFIL